MKPEIQGKRLTEDEYQKKKNRRRRIKFDPSREFIDSSVQDYLDSGGKITRVVVDFDETFTANFVGDLEDFLS